VVASWEYGGLEKHVIELSNALSKQHQVTVIAHPQMQQYFAPEVTVIPVDFSQSRWSPRLYWQLTQILGQLQPDIIHAQASKAALLIARIRPFLKFTARYVATLHNQKGTTSMFESFDRVIVVSPQLAGLIKKAPTTAIYNGVRLPAPAAGLDRGWLAGQFGLDAARPVLVAVGRLVPAKGFDILIPAAAKAGVQVVIVGEGEQRELLQKQIAESQAQVVLAGFRTDVPALMAAADGFILSSRNEGFAYVFVEALLSKLPVVATAIPMVQEFIPADLIVPIADVDALADKLRWVVDHRPQWLDIMAGVWRMAEQQLTLEAMVRQTEAVYH
jgi:glycosyltransferase involved in cell wall biosynthesis